MLFGRIQFTKLFQTRIKKKKNIILLRGAKEASHYNKGGVFKDKIPKERKKEGREGGGGGGPSLDGCNFRVAILGGCLTRVSWYLFHPLPNSKRIRFLSERC